MIWEGICQTCKEVVEFISNKADRDNDRTHIGEDKDSQCPGQLKRVPFPRDFAVKWKYGKHDKKGTFMGPSKHIYKTDTTMKRDAKKTRTVHGGAYRGKVHKDRT